MTFDEMNDDGFFHTEPEEPTARDEAYDRLDPEDDPECEEHWADLKPAAE